MSEAVTIALALRSLHAGTVTPNYDLLFCRFLIFRSSAEIRVPSSWISARIPASNLAFFSRLIRDTGRDIAFERLPHLAAALSQRYRDHRRIEIRAVALGREQGTASFHFVKGSLEESWTAATCGPGDATPPIETIAVATRHVRSPGGRRLIG